jgi:L-ascorbate metabolism protein UlaG (beta-lactamase superfamily)
MSQNHLAITHIGGPTALLDFVGVRFLTDPTFDPPGGEYTTGPVTLRKLTGPALTSNHLEGFDYVLLSHDHHFDNLDHSGRALLPWAQKVLTTQEGSQRLGENSVGLKEWQEQDILLEGRTFRVVATPARHGPAGSNRGQVIGFVLFFADTPENAVYVSGDTVWYEGVAEVAKRFPIRTAMLHLGAARVPAVGSFHLTMTADEAVQAAQAFSEAAIVPVHYEGWAHFSEGRTQIEDAFRAAGLSHRVHWAEAGKAMPVAA